jgi:tRNA-2-methylthio-N6-dimethylallyladenosine synthase
MNAHDSERISGLLEEDGMEMAEHEDDADVVVLNTCCIRENADEKLYGTLGWLKPWKEAGKNLGRERQIVVAGCLAQKDKDLVREKAPYVDVVMGTHNVHRAIELLDMASVRGGITEIFDEAVIDDHALFPSALPVKRERSYNAWVTIQIGCDNSCTYCIVPSVRGEEISRPFGDIVAEVQGLAAQGVTEISLLGQNVNSYGRDLSLAKKRGGDLDIRVRPQFAELLRAVGSVEGVRRVRYVSPHPKDMNLETLQAMADTAAVCEHLHYPLQSGSDRVLSLMHRGYTAERYLSRMQEARALIPDLAVTTDIIVGFPGETEEDHDQLLQFVEDAQLDWCGFFTFSPEEGTHAMTLPDHVPAELMNERIAELREMQDNITANRRDALIGRTVEVLVDEVGIGRTHWEAPSIDGIVHVSRDLPVGEFATVLIVDAMGPDLVAEGSSVEDSDDEEGDF